MGTFKEKIRLVNARDAGNAREKSIPDAKVRSMTLDAMPDTGAWTLVINEDTREKLGLGLNGSINSSLADETTTAYSMTEAVDLMVDPVNEKLTGVHGDQPLHKLK
jgi:hypothetical protein